jgi:hypothetical protein
LSTPLELIAQDDEYRVNLYGFTSTVFSAYTPHNEPVLGNGVVSNYLAVAQTDIFLSADLGSQFRFLIDLQVLNDFGAQLTINPFLHQAWGEWRPSDAFGIRAGRILTPFAYFNSVHSRPALYWFIERPFAYQEPTFTEDMAVLRPEFAQVSVSGTARLTDDIKLDYAGYVGNTDVQVGSGLDLNSRKLLGARVALRTDNVTVGFSPVMNKVTPEDSVSQNVNTIFALDLQANLAGFTLIGEYIALSERFERIPGAPVTAPVRDGTFSKAAWFASLAYNFTDAWLGFVGYEYFHNTDSDSRFNPGKAATRFHAGLNFRPSERVLLKAEATQFNVASTPNFKNFLSLNLAAVFSF